MSLFQPIVQLSNHAAITLKLLQNKTTVGQQAPNQFGI